MFKLAKSYLLGLMGSSVYSISSARLGMLDFTSSLRVPNTPDSPYAGLTTSTTEESSTYFISETDTASSTTLAGTCTDSDSSRLPRRLAPILS